MARTTGPKAQPQAKPTRKPRGFWNRPDTIKTLQRVIDKKITVEQAMDDLGCDEEDIRWYTRELSRGRLSPKESPSTETVSFRLTGDVSARLWRLSRIAGRSIGEMAAMLLNEKLREEEFPFIEFRASPLGRQAFIKGTSLAVWEVVLVGRQLGMDPERTAAYLQWPEPKVRSALAYAQAFKDEIEPLVSETESMDLDNLRRKLPWVHEVQA